MPGRPDGGFTLIEILVVFLIIGLILSVVSPMLRRNESFEMRSAARNLTLNLRKARSEAVIKNLSVAVIVDTKNKQFRLETQDKQYELPASAEILVTTVESEVDGDRAGVRFFPDGSSTGGTIELAGEKSGYTLAVDWLTGGVQLKHGVAD